MLQQIETLYVVTVTNLVEEHAADKPDSNYVKNMYVILGVRL